VTTTDVFQTAVTAMASFGDVPLAGEIYGIDITRLGGVRVNLEEDDKQAQALLAWFYSLSRAELTHHHGDTCVFIAVAGSFAGVQWSIWCAVTGEDMAVACDCVHDQKVRALSVHRLRLVQMQQLARAVAA
jgi:hypothetical protein